MPWRIADQFGHSNGLVSYVSVNLMNMDTATCNFIEADRAKAQKRMTKNCWIIFVRVGEIIWKQLPAYLPASFQELSKETIQRRLKEDLQQITDELLPHHNKKRIVWCMDHRLWIEKKHFSLNMRCYQMVFLDHNQRNVRLSPVETSIIVICRKRTRPIRSKK